LEDFMRAIHWILMAAASSGCLVHEHVGFEDGATSDASTSRDGGGGDGSPATDSAPVVDASRDAIPERDAASGDAAPVDAALRPITHVTVIAGSTRGLGDWVGGVAVRLLTSAPADDWTFPDTPRETVGNCSAYSPTPRAPEYNAVDAGPIVTVSVADGAPQTLRFVDAANGYVVGFDHAVPDGTPGVVTIASRAGVIPALTIPITFSVIRFQAPVPRINTSNIQNVTYTVGTDFTATWPSVALGDAHAQVRMWFMAPETGTTSPNEVVCTVTPSSGSATAPWALLNRWVSSSSAPGPLDTTSVAISYFNEATTTQNGVTVRVTNGSGNLAYLVSH
jgi:hypothetical protein